ncbi:MAG: trimethylamine methyltransferase family protein [Hyphomicrobiales bacterium]|nr:trimethylamine methyltransferase family protein [Hyphomicrobiales bacterium]MCP5373825.1 trimethylamine methyltransferase family protein [Hyphomicrobiales bacterium]
MPPSPRPRRRSPRDRAQEQAGIPQLPWRSVVNPYAPLEVVSADQVEAIHDTSMRVLEELGIEVMSPRTVEMLAAAGAEVDRATGLVRLDRGLVAERLATVPPVFTLTPRNPDKRLTVGANHLNFALVSGPPNVHDRVRGRRPGTFADYCELISLAHHFNAVHMTGNQAVAPIDLPANSRHLDAYRANLTYTDMVYSCTSIGRGRALDGIAMMAIARGLTLEQMAADPAVMTVISVNSPRRFDEAMAEGLIAMAEHGQAACVTPFTLMGAMSPVTLAAALAQQNAEALFGIVLTQVVNPGAPAVYGGFTSNVDMRSGAPAFGTPENAQANVISGQLARRYGLPYRSTPPNAANVADAQAAYETQMALWGAVLGHANVLLHAAGWLEGGLVASYEKLILDIEMLQHMMEFLRPPATGAADLGFEALRDVAPGGHFFGAAHTLERYETAFYQPLVSDWRNSEAWADAGAEDATRRATALWQRALAEYRKPPLDPAVAEELDAYVARRREQIGDGEP